MSDNVVKLHKTVQDLMVDSLKILLDKAKEGHLVALEVSGLERDGGERRSVSILYVHEHDMLEMTGLLQVQTGRLVGGSIEYMNETGLDKDGHPRNA